MSEYFFGTHSGHLKKAADRIAEKHGAHHVNYSEYKGPGQIEKRGWFACINRGNPFDQNTAAAVMADIDAIGGLAALKKKR